MGRRSPLEPLLELKNRGVRIQDGAEAYEIVTGKIPLESLGLESLLFSAGFQVSRSLLIYKRIASIIVSAIGLLVTLPLMPLIAAAIRLDSNGPIIFRQRRVGQSGKIFILYKFRTMIDGADQEDNYAPAEILDRRFTRVGRFLRRARLDEIPQFFNIFRGDMHFIGPRPFVPNQEETCVEKISFYRQRWVIKPGATSWAQVNRGYNVTIEDNKEKLAYDLLYQECLSRTGSAYFNHDRQDHVARKGVTVGASHVRGNFLVKRVLAWLCLSWLPGSTLLRWLLSIFPSSFV